MSTRRDVFLAAPGLAAAAALPVAGAATQPDPALEAVNEWLAAYRAEEETLSRSDNWDDPECVAVRKAEWAARTKASTTVATTPAGLAAQLLLTVNFIGQIEPWTDPDSAEAIEQGQWNWRDDLDRKALVSLLTGARALSQA